MQQEEDLSVCPCMFKAPEWGSILLGGAVVEPGTLLAFQAVHSQRRNAFLEDLMVCWLCC